MLRRVCLWLLVLPVSALGAQSGAGVRVTIGDSAGTDRYELVVGRQASAGALQPTKHLVGAGVLVMTARDSGSLTIRTDDPALPVHVRVESGTSRLSAVGAVVIVRVVGDSASIEARDRSFLTPGVRRSP